MSNSVRRLTREQFADGTTIDGNRLEGALDDIVNRVNAVEIGDIERRFFQTQYVGGYMPMPVKAPALVLADDVGVQDVFPWMDVYNGKVTTTNNASDALVTPPNGFQNRYRMKGTFNDDIDPERIDAGYQPDQFVWTSAIPFTRPSIIIGVSVFIHVDGVAYSNDLVYAGVGQPDHKIPNGTLRDFAVELSVDNPVTQELRKLNDIEYHRINFRFDSRRFSNLGGVNGSVISRAATDMSPAHPVNSGGTKTPGGMWLDDQNLNVPVHENARVRLSFLIPEYTGAASGWDDGDTYQGQYWSWAVTALEEIE